MGKGKTGRKGDEGKSNGAEGGGGVGRRENEEKKRSHYSIDMKSTLPIEVISSGGWEEEKMKRKKSSLFNRYEVHTSN